MIGSCRVRIGYEDPSCAPSHDDHDIRTIAKRIPWCGAVGGYARRPFPRRQAVRTFEEPKNAGQEASGTDGVSREMLCMSAVIVRGL